MSSVIISLPWPPSKSSANGSQGDWRGKATAGRAYKNHCLLSLIEQQVKPLTKPLLRVDLMFYPPKNYRYDLDNILARTKRGLDAVAERIGVDDAEWPEMRLARGHKVRGGAVSVHIITEGGNE